MRRRAESPDFWVYYGSPALPIMHIWLDGFCGCNEPASLLTQMDAREILPKVRLRGWRQSGFAGPPAIWLVSIAVVLVGLLTLASLTSWGPLAHWACENARPVAHDTDALIPSVLVNSPYGGIGNGTGLTPWNFPTAENGVVGWGAGNQGGLRHGRVYRESTLRSLVRKAFFS